MNTITARRISALVLGASIASVPLAVTTAHADAASRPSKADRSAMVAANRFCEDIPGESQFEACVIGAFTLTTDRYVGGHFTTDFTRDADHYIVLTRASKRIR
jgi:hypothetical protein